MQEPFAPDPGNAGEGIGDRKIHVAAHFYFLVVILPPSGGTPAVA